MHECERGDVVVELRGDGLAGDKLRADARDERELRNAPVNHLGRPPAERHRLAETLAFRGRVRLGEPHRLGGGDGVTTRRAGETTRARAVPREARAERPRAHGATDARKGTAAACISSRDRGSARRCGTTREPFPTSRRVAASRRRALRRWMKFGKRAGDGGRISDGRPDRAFPEETRAEKAGLGDFFGEDRFAIRIRASLNFARDDDVECGVHHRGFATGGGGAHTDRRADDTDHLEARDWAVRVQGYPSCTRARRARGARSESPPPARRGTLATHFSPEAPRAPPVTPDDFAFEARERARGRPGSRLTSARPNARAQTQDRAHARAPGDRPARRTQPRGCVVAPRAPPATHAFLSRSSRPHARRRGFPPATVVRRARRVLHAEPSRYRHRPLPPQVSARLFARENLDPRVAPSFAPRTQVRPLPSPSA